MEQFQRLTMPHAKKKWVYFCKWREAYFFYPLNTADEKL